MSLRLIRGSPISISGPAHIVYADKQLCTDPVPSPITWSRADIWERKDVCSICTRALLKTLGVSLDASEADVLRLLRGDYDAANPNRFWREYGVTKWSSV